MSYNSITYFGQKINVIGINGKAQRLEFYLSSSKEPFFSYDARTNTVNETGNSQFNISMLLKYVAQGNPNGRSQLPNFVKSYAKTALKVVKSAPSQHEMTLEDISTTV